MPAKFERFVGFYELSVRPARVTDATAPISYRAVKNIRGAVLAAKQAGNPIKKVLLEDQLYIICDDFKLYPKRKLAAILFTVADINSADAVYRDVQSSSIRRFRKVRFEGGAISAHCVINLEAHPNTNRYPVALEDVEGVSRSRVLPFLEDLFRSYCGQVTAQTDEGPREGDAVLELDSVQKDKMTDAAGRPVSVELVRLRPRRSLDPNNTEGYTETRRSVVFRIDQDIPLSEQLKSLLRLRSRQKTEFNQYPVMRIRWKRPDNKTQTLSIDGLAEDLMQRAFTRMELISNISPELPSSMIDIRDDFVDKISRLL